MDAGNIASSYTCNVPGGRGGGGFSPEISDITVVNII